MTTYVAIIGPGQRAAPDEVALAIEVGRLVAQRGWIVVTGGLGGVMAGAARGCEEVGGVSLGLLPGEDRSGANPHLQVTIPTGLGEMRNALLVRTADAIIAIGRSWGTVSEVALACRTGVPVVVIDAPTLFDEVSRGEDVAPRHAADAAEAVAMVAQALGDPDPMPPRAVPSDAFVVGVDGAKGGWLGALLPVCGHGVVRLIAAPDIASLIERAEPVAPVLLAGVDTPIGLPDNGSRHADALARARLGGRASTVFSAPVRDAVLAPTYAAAREISVERTGGRSLSAQSYALRRAIIDVDQYVRDTRSARLVEVHPEVSYAAMAGAPLRSRKHDPEGMKERLGVLRASGIEVPKAALRGGGVDDVLDAAAAAWTAARVARGVAECLPDPPERFSDGLDAAIWV